MRAGCCSTALLPKGLCRRTYVSSTAWRPTWPRAASSSTIKPAHETPPPAPDPRSRPPAAGTAHRCPPRHPARRSTPPPRHPLPLGRLLPQRLRLRRLHALRLRPLRHRPPSLLRSTAPSRHTGGKRLLAPRRPGLFLRPRHTGTHRARRHRRRGRQHHLPLHPRRRRRRHPHLALDRGLLRPPLLRRMPDTPPVNICFSAILQPKRLTAAHSGPQSNYIRGEYLQNT